VAGNKWTETMFGHFRVRMAALVFLLYKRDTNSLSTLLNQKLVGNEGKTDLIFDVVCLL
jgi:hypothetical protein